MTSTASHLTADDRRRFFSLFFPALAEGILTQLFGWADTAMLGRLPDSAGVIAAVGATSGLVNFTLCVTRDYNVGATTAVAYAYGAGKRDRVRELAKQTLCINLFISTVITLFCTLFAPVIVPLVCKNPALHAYATEYYRIVAIGFFFVINTQAVTALLRGVGYTKIPMIYNLTAGLLNVFLNYCLIGGNLGFPALGVAGAAIATVTSQGTSLLFALLFLLFANTPVRIFREGRFLPTKETIVVISSVGLVTAFEQLLLQGGGLISTRIVSGLPQIDYAGYIVVATIEGLVWSYGSALCTASTTLTGQCAGEGEIPKIRLFVRLIISVGLVLSAFFFASYFVFGEALASMFTEDAEVVEVAVRLLRVSGYALPCITVHLTLGGVLRAAHDGKAPLFASFSSLWLFRVLLGFILINVLGYGIFAARLCLVLDQAWRALVNAVVYFAGKWKKKAAAVHT